MILKGDSKSTTNSHTHKDPPKWAQPGLSTAAEDAKALYDKNKAQREQGISQVPELSSQTQAAINGLLEAAKQYENAYIKNQFQGEPLAVKNLKDLAEGKNIGSNEDFKESLQKVLDQAATTINSRMSGYGRYGSGANQTILSKTLGNIAQSAQGQQYNQDILNMLRANKQLDRAQNNQIANANNYYKGQSNAFLAALTGGQVLDKKQQEKANESWSELEKLLSISKGAAGNYGDSYYNSTKTKSSGGGGFLDFLKKLIGF